jgi:hypothetical protein
MFFSSPQPSSLTVVREGTNQRHDAAKLVTPTNTRQ